MIGYIMTKKLSKYHMNMMDILISDLEGSSQKP